MPLIEIVWFDLCFLPWADHVICYGGRRCARPVLFWSHNLWLHWRRYGVFVWQPPKLRSLGNWRLEDFGAVSLKFPMLLLVLFKKNCKSLFCSESFIISTLLHSCTVPPRFYLFLKFKMSMMMYMYVRVTGWTVTEIRQSLAHESLLEWQTHCTSHIKDCASCLTIKVFVLEVSNCWEFHCKQTVVIWGRRLFATCSLYLKIKWVLFTNFFKTCKLHCSQFKSIYSPPLVSHPPSLLQFWMSLPEFSAQSHLHFHFFSYHNICIPWRLLWAENSEEQSNLKL